MNETFKYCVDLLYQVAHLTGMTYEEVNIWLFVIIHPAITILFALIAFHYINRYRNARRELSKERNYIGSL